jgi:hypothetical protein
VLFELAEHAGFHRLPRLPYLVLLVPPPFEGLDAPEC